MLWYIIDGWNVAHKIGGFKRRAVSYEELVSFILSRRLTGSRNNRVTIVFDGRSPVSASRWPGNVEVLFSGDKSADDVICKKVERTKRRKHIVVVSNDRKIQDYVKMHGASVKGVEEFLGRLKKKAERDGLDKGKNKNISYRLQREITEELKKVWLGEDES